MKKQLKRIACILLVMGILLSVPVNAAIPYNSYLYDAWGNSVLAPVGYKPDTVYHSMDSVQNGFKNPSDLFIANDGSIYVSDTGNNRIAVFDKNMHLLRLITVFHTLQGDQPLSSPAGLFVDRDNNLFVALPEEHRLVMIDSEDNYVREFTRPETDLIDKAIEFKPSKVLVNRSGTVFALVDGLYLGAIMYDDLGSFLGFYGANDVVMTFSLLVDYYWKKMMSQAQISKMARYVPVQFSNFAIDEDDFIFTCTNDSTTTLNEICKMNAIGNNVLTQWQQNVASFTGDYGDLERGVYRGKTQDTAFIDICVNPDGMIFALDKARGRIFEYDQESKLLNVFGAIGYQEGAFQNPVAIDVFDGKVFVLDSGNGNITKFVPTDYGASMEQAVQLYNRGYYSDAKEYWEKALSYNSNCELAYAGIGKALYESGDYKEAMDYFRLGYDRTSYSRAFKEYRLSVVRNVFPFVITGLLLLLIGFIVYRKISRKWNAPKTAVKPEKQMLLKQLLNRPTETFQELKYHKRWNVVASFVIIFLWFLSVVFNKQLTDFKFNYNNTDNFNVIYIFVSTFGLLVLWTIINWAVAALLDGKGTIREIWVSSTYAMIPYIGMSLINVLLSHFLTIDEGVFITIISAVSFLWSAFLIIDAMHVIHDYSIVKTVGSILLVIASIVFVIFLCVLFFGLIQQLMLFLKTIYVEMMLRR